MVGHGFNSEVAQHKTMAATFDSNASNDTLKSLQASPNQAVASDNHLGKIHFSAFLSFLYALDTNVRRKRTNDA